MASGFFQSATDGKIVVDLVTRGAADLTALQGVLEHAPTYFIAIDGEPARPDAARRLRDARPKGLGPEDKLTVVFSRDGGAVGAADVLVGHPDREAAFISLLVLDERWQGQGNGRRCFDLVERELRERCPALRRLRLAVVDGEVGAAAFWQRMGFVATGETIIYRDGDAETTLVLYEKPLRPLAAR